LMRRIQQLFSIIFCDSFHFWMFSRKQRSFFYDISHDQKEKKIEIYFKLDGLD
jgi:hypothetical protein